MQRHLLFRRKQQRLFLWRHLLKKQPLVERIAGQKARLSTMLNLPPEPSPELTIANTSRFQSWQPVSAADQSPPFAWSFDLNQPEATGVVLPAEEFATSTLPPEQSETSALPAEEIETAALSTDEARTLGDQTYDGKSDAKAEALHIPSVSQHADVAPPSLPNDSAVQKPIPMNSSDVLLPQQQSDTTERQSERQVRSRIIELRPGNDHLTSTSASGETRVEESLQKVQQEQPDTEQTSPWKIDSDVEKQEAQPEPVSQTATDKALNPTTPSPSGTRDSEESADELFAPRASDRSPQAWFARLNRQAQMMQAKTMPVPGQQTRTEQVKKTVRTEAPKNSSAARIPEPISQRARILLRPLVGIDPDEVPLYRDQQAGQNTNEWYADALSTDTAIEIAPAFSEETPEKLGLLAHELTHIARRQRPRFIPPVLHTPTSVTTHAPTAEVMDEEEVALHVERRVRQAASNAMTINPQVQMTASPLPDGLGKEENNASSRAGVKQGIWGNLPAPWEPLPDWLVSTTVAPDSSTTLMPTIPVVSAPVLSNGQESGSSTPVESGVRRAGIERSIEEPHEEAQQSAPSEPPKAPEPDLDALARQVYSLLKRRLSVEQRREL